MPRPNIYSSDFEYDDADPPGYRNGVARVGKAAGGEALAVVVCFPPGPAGAHKATNRGETTARVLMFSSARRPAVAVYPDSDKIGVWPGNADDKVMLRRADGGVDYWDGEA